MQHFVELKKVLALDAFHIRLKYFNQIKKENKLKNKRGCPSAISIAVIPNDHISL